MQASAVITLTTDFGYNDPFVGIMKGVIRGINPSIEIIDITHGITPQDIREAAFVIGTSYAYFPRNSIHIVVVDPGVGSERRPIIVMTDNHYFIGPDNGVFTLVYLNSHEQLQVTAVTAEHYFLQNRGATFHGRDVFAPVAAWFSKGIRAERLGDIVEDYRSIDLPMPRRSEDGLLHGEVIHIDRFGNAITNIKAEDIQSLLGKKKSDLLRIRIKDRAVPLREFYSQGPAGELCALIDSSDLLELFVYLGSAATAFGIKAGDGVEASVI